MWREDSDDTGRMFSAVRSAGPGQLTRPELRRGAKTTRPATVAESDSGTGTDSDQDLPLVLILILVPVLLLIQILGPGLVLVPVQILGRSQTPKLKQMPEFDADSRVCAATRGTRAAQLVA